MNKRALYLFGALLLLAFAGFSLASFRSNLTPYVSFADATASPRAVQVAGGLVKGSGAYDDVGKALVFTLSEANGPQTLRVRFHGVKPANFEDAISIVAIGQYDPTRQEFAASKLLVKCPSKYQGAEVKTYGG
ncbi:MAG: cytochrome c maturation protein CcmE [Thermoanaerobaculia bacterium]